MKARRTVCGKWRERAAIYGKGGYTVTTSIRNRDVFQIYDEAGRKTFYGFDQEWYATRWQRCAGCGPTAASNILYYLRATRGGRESAPLTKSRALSLMEEVYQYVRPTARGIPTAKLLHDDLLDYARAKGIPLRLGLLDVPKDRMLRPPLGRVLSFVEEALQNDTPVAFLNLHNGTEKNLDSWHWVTIISVEHSGDETAAPTEILDEGTIKRIDLAQWFRTTSLGGGFVSVDLQ